MKINNIYWQQRIKNCNPPAQSEIDVLKLRLSRKVYNLRAIPLFSMVFVVAGIIAIATLIPAAAFIAAAAAACLVILMFFAVDAVVLASVRRSLEAMGIFVIPFIVITFAYAGIVALVVGFAIASIVAPILSVVIAAFAAAVVVVLMLSAIDTAVVASARRSLEAMDRSESLLPLGRSDPVVKAYLNKLGKMGREITNIEVSELKRFCKSKEGKGLNENGNKK